MKILIAEDFLLNADTLEVALRQSIACEEIQKVVSGAQLLQIWAGWQPDLIIVDLLLPVVDGVEAIRQVRNKDRNVLILAISMHKDRRMIEQAFQAGANGFFFKGSDFSKFINAVKAVLGGNRYIDDSILDLLLTHARQHDSTQLTPQELRVLTLLASGKSSEQIADLLSVSVATVKFHRSNLLQKSGKRNVAELVHWATVQQLI